MCSTEKSVTDTGEDLPKGWTLEFKTRMNGSRAGKQYKCYISPSGYKFYSMKDVSRYLEDDKTQNCTSKRAKAKAIKNCSPKAERIKNCTSKPKRSGVMQSNTHVLVERKEAVDGLPEGWIHEVVTQKIRKKIRKDPYYIDPKTGYAFRSKPDVFRYLETGDISKCAIKPQKRDINTSKAIVVKSSPPTIAESEMLKTGQSSNSDEVAKDGQVLECSLALGIPISNPLEEREKLNGGQSSSVDEAAEDVSGKHSNHEGGCIEPSSVGPVEAKVSKRGGQPRNIKKVAVKKQLVSAPTTTVVSSENGETGVEKHGDTKTKPGSKKRKERTELDTPRRTSKRLAAIGSKQAPSMEIGNQTLAVVLQPSLITAKQEVNPASPCKGTENKLSEASMEKCAFQDSKQPAQSAIPVGDQVSPDKLERGKGADQEPESSVAMSFGDDLSVQDYFQDPCLEFAFKTLTGAIPVDENMVVEDYFQPQAGSTQTENTNGTALNDIVVDDFVLDLAEKAGSESQLQMRTPLAAEKPAPESQLHMPTPSSLSGNESLSGFNKNVEHVGDEGKTGSTTKVNP